VKRCVARPGRLSPLVRSTPSEAERQDQTTAYGRPKAGRQRATQVAAYAAESHVIPPTGRTSGR